MVRQLVSGPAAVWYEQLLYFIILHFCFETFDGYVIGVISAKHTPIIAYNIFFLNNNYHFRTKRANTVLLYAQRYFIFFILSTNELKE